MSSIGSVGSSSGYNYSSSVQRQRPDPSKIAENVFSKLDTKGQGYLEVSDLESAFSSINSSSTTSGVSTTSSTNAATGSSSTTSTEISDLFKKLDSDGDGKVTKQEFSSGLKKLSDELESQFNARRTSGTQDANRPPPPPDGDQNGGLSKDQLSSLASDVSKTDSTAGAKLTSVAQNFNAADTNQDGKVSLQETLAYLEKTASNTSTNASASTSGSANSTSGSNSESTTGSNSSSGTNNDAAIFKKALQLLRAYADPFQVNGGSSGSSVSVSA
ncbi:EF-hand domain-containing protein [Undibacterium sp. RuTC16W]|uniref:EF-hand domain-containing protein n=1 Tax=Undibacterium sp. RuTC16W TaxID=3413048 RepID=UPI003BF07B50